MSRVIEPGRYQSRRTLPYTGWRHAGPQQGCVGAVVTVDGRRADRLHTHFFPKNVPGQHADDLRSVGKIQ